jgi:hypothetical protein
MYAVRDLGQIDELTIVGCRPQVEYLGFKVEIKDYFQLKSRGDIKDISYVQGEVPFFALAVWEEPESYCIFASAPNLI